MKGSSFTLVELLMVIVIAAFLIALLVPLMQSSRQRAQTVLCGSKVKQLLAGLVIYETDNQAFPYGFNSNSPFPPQGGYPGNSAYDRKGWWWFNCITSYPRREKDEDSVLWCPSRQIKDPKLDYVLHGNFGVNQSICKMSHGRESYTEFIGVPLRSTDISHPGQTLLVFDSSYSMINWWHATNTPPVPLGNSTIEDTAYVPGLWINKERALWPGQEEDAVNGRHPNKTVNVGFADGHVERTKADNLHVEKVGDSYKNLRPLWVPK